VRSPGGLIVSFGCIEAAGLGGNAVGPSIFVVPGFTDDSLPLDAPRISRNTAWLPMLLCNFADWCSGRGACPIRCEVDALEVAARGGPLRS
jgi:hypothetical protein